MHHMACKISIRFALGKALSSSRRKHESAPKNFRVAATLSSARSSSAPPNRYRTILPKAVPRRARKSFYGSSIPPRDRRRKRLRSSIWHANTASPQRKTRLIRSDRDLHAPYDQISARQGPNRSPPRRKTPQGKVSANAFPVRRHASQHRVRAIFLASSPSAVVVRRRPQPPVVVQRRRQAPLVVQRRR